MNLTPEFISNLSKTDPEKAARLQELLTKAESIIEEPSPPLPDSPFTSTPQEELQEICQDFGASPELKSEPDPDRVRIFHDFIRSIRHQAKIFLQKELPANSKYHDLKLQQEVVKRNFKLDDFLERPSRIDGPFMTAFNNFKKLFVDTFIDECSAQRPTVIAFLKQRQSFEQKLKALEVLDQISALGEPVSPPLLDSFSQAFSQVSICDKKPGDSECRREVEKNAGCHFFHLSCNFEPLISSFEKDLDIALSSKIDQIKSAGIEKLLNESHDNDLRKLIDLLHLDKMDRLISLLSTSQGAKIAQQIQTILQ